MRFLLLFITLFLQLNVQGNTMYNLEKNSTQNILTSKKSSLNERSFIDFRFAGQYYDQETELCYSRFRYYDPSTGLFTQQDPIGLAGGMPNMYAYVYDSNTQIDPFGLTITHLHHTIPRQIYNPRSGKAPLLPEHLATDRDIIGKKGNPNRWAVPADEHRALHSPKSDISIKNGGDYNARWKQELNILETKVPDKSKWTKKDILDIRDKLTKEFEIDKYKPSCH